MAKAFVIGDMDFELKDVTMPMPKQADSTATAVATLKDDFNALLKKLQDAGLMSAT